MKITEGLKGANKGYFTISLEKLKEENKALYGDPPINHVIISSTDKKFKCFYCEDSSSSNNEQRNHREQYHQTSHSTIQLKKILIIG
jgi:hypothetical protein